MGFLTPNNDFRFILPTETDYKSPLSEELMSQIRENLECNTMNRIYSGYRAKVVTRDSGTQLTIEKISNDDSDWPANIAAALVLTFRSGIALGQNFAVTANTELLDTPDTATVTIAGSPDFPASILAGDELLIMYAQTGQAHTHDGIDSAPLGVVNTEWIEDVGAYFGSNLIAYATGIQDVLKPTSPAPPQGGFSSTGYIQKTATTNIVFGNFTIRSSTLTGFNGRTVFMRVPAGTYYYTDASGARQSYVVSSDIDGPPITVSGFTNNTYNTIVIPKEYGINLSIAGIPDGVVIYTSFFMNVSTTISNTILTATMKSSAL